ncbi:hypothetical protein ACFC26_16005 [Kitasatospora purpeofusca]|uniref:hypothetical protein n=1 Tax=Kitasatospora purpeofusca TaxID=67352 RepID=UPI0035D851FA
MTTWTVLATCGPAALLGLWWLHRITTLRRLPMPDLPDDLGVTPATTATPAILWARYGCTLRLTTAPGTQLPATPEEPQP